MVRVCSCLYKNSFALSRDNTRLPPFHTGSQHTRHGNRKHRTRKPETDLNAPNAGTENTGRGNRKHPRFFSLFNARREPKTPSQELKTPAGTEKTEPGTENTAAREPKTHLGTKNTAGTENTNAGRKNTAGTENTNPGTKSPEPFATGELDRSDGRSDEEKSAILSRGKGSP